MFLNHPVTLQFQKKDWGERSVKRLALLFPGDDDVIRNNKLIRMWINLKFYTIKFGAFHRQKNRSGGKKNNNIVIRFYRSPGLLADHAVILRDCRVLFTGPKLSSTLSQSAILIDKLFACYLPDASWWFSAAGVLVMINFLSLYISVQLIYSGAWMDIFLHCTVPYREHKTGCMYAWLDMARPEQSLRNNTQCWKTLQTCMLTAVRRARYFSRKTVIWDSMKAYYFYSRYILFTYQMFFRI